MECRQCGSTELTLSVLGLGCWAFGGGSYWGEDHDQKAVNYEVRRAVDLGLTYFDTAEAYNDGRSEESLGKALKGIARDNIIIGTKVLPGNTRPETLTQHCEASLRRLDLDHIDLYMLHWPITPLAIGAFGKNEIATNPPSPEEVFGTLMTLQKQGKIGHIGVSNFGVEFLSEATETGATIAANQIVYSLLSRGVEFEILPYCRDNGIGLIGYMTILQGILADIWPTIEDIPPNQRRFRLFDSKNCNIARHGESGADLEITRTLNDIREITKETGIGMTDLAIKWAAAADGMACILVGTRNMANLERNIQAMEKPLSSELKAQLDTVTDAVKQKLGPSIDLFESAARDRSRVRESGDPGQKKAIV